MIYIKTSIQKRTAAPTAKSDRILIIDARDILVDIVREFGNTHASGSLVLAEGAKAVSIQASRPSIAAGYENSGELDARVFADKVEFDYPGDSVACSNLIEAIANIGVVIIIQKCGGGAKIYGSKCNPLILNVEPTDSHEACRVHFSMSQEMGDAYMPRTYTGAIPDVWDDYGNWIGALLWNPDEKWLDFN